MCMPRRLWGCLCWPVKLESMSKCLLSLINYLTLNALGPRLRRTKGWWTGVCFAVCVMEKSYVVVMIT